MLCRDFEKISGDLAAGRLMEAGKRERALSHASDCSVCALRMKAERSLEMGLRALGREAEDMEAPPHLKMALRFAFDRQAKNQPVVAFKAARKPVRTPYWTAAAAAALIVVALGAVLIMLNSSSTNTKQNISDKTNVPANPGAQSAHSVTEPGDKIPKLPKHIETTVSQIARKKPTEGRARRSSSFDEMASYNENVTEYIPLTYLADSTAMESGTVLRVELPTSALVSMGLPAPIDRGDLRVKADVIIGDDGVTRAVRLVGQNPPRK